MTLNPIKIYKQIASLLRVKGMVQKMSASELKTSEGRLTLLMQILGIYSAVQGFIPAPLAAKLMVASVAAYAIARSLVKVGEAIAPLTKTTKDDEIVSEAGKLLDAAKVAVEPKK